MCVYVYIYIENIKLLSYFRFSNDDIIDIHTRRHTYTHIFIYSYTICIHICIHTRQYTYRYIWSIDILPDTVIIEIVDKSGN